MPQVSRGHTPPVPTFLQYLIPAKALVTESVNLGDGLPIIVSKEQTEESKWGKFLNSQAEDKFNPQAAKYCGDRRGIGTP